MPKKITSQYTTVRVTARAHYLLSLLRENGTIANLSNGVEQLAQERIRATVGDAYNKMLDYDDGKL
jgi:hypothetical protein